MIKAVLPRHCRPAIHCFKSAKGSMEKGKGTVEHAIYNKCFPAAKIDISAD